MPRPRHCRRISAAPKRAIFLPEGGGERELHLELDCLEALRLADYEGLTSDAGALRMGISRHTFGRLLRKAHKTVATAILEGAALRIGGGVCVGQADGEQGERNMSEAILVAVPSDAPGGLGAAPSAHFGHCAAYTIAKVENGAIEEVKVEKNKGHEHGGCVQPVQELARQGVKALLAGGMGMKPLSAMQEAGIKVYYSTGFATVKEALEAFAAGKLTAFGTDQLCKGNCGHHGLENHHRREHE